MEETQVIYMDLPLRIRGMTIKTFDESGGEDCYAIVINSRLSYEQQKRACIHELEHIERGDFYSGESLQRIEAYAHT